MIQDLFLCAFTLSVSVWCCYLLYDTFRNERFIRVIELCGVALAGLLAVGSIMTGNALVICYTISQIVMSYLLIIFGNRIERSFEKRFIPKDVMKGWRVRTTKTKDLIERPSGAGRRNVPSRQKTRLRFTHERQKANG